MITVEYAWESNSDRNSIRKGNFHENQDQKPVVAKINSWKEFFADREQGGLSKNQWILHFRVIEGEDFTS